LSNNTPSREEIEASIAALEAQRALLGDAIGPAIAALRAQLSGDADEVRGTENQRKQITVVFADVQGFTKMSETMDPEDVAETLNSLWERIDRVITDHGGRVDKHIGDAVMALFGAPVAHEDDPERAIRAALAMQETIGEIVASRGPAVASLQMRVGINTGLAMLGTVGSNNEYTAIGHTVNLASRLEGLAPPGGVLISQSTMNLAIGLFNLEATEPLTVKGVEGPVQAFRIKSAKPRTFRVGPREVAGVQTRMVGRDDEILRLKTLLPETPNDQPGEMKLVTIVGDPGVGKSRLVYEYFNHLEANPFPVWLFRGRAVESSRDTAYSVLRSILSDRFLIADSDSPATAKSKLEEGMARYMGVDAGIAAPVLGHLIGLDYSDHPAVSGIISDPKVLRDKGFKAFQNMLVAGCVNTYLVFLIEDIHWADEESLDLLEFLADELALLPVVIMCTARPDLFQFRSEWAREESNRLMFNLDPLDDSATDLLIDDVLQRLGDAPGELRRLIAQRAEGNPFFMEELVKMLIDDGVIDVSGEQWAVRLDELSRANIPSTLTGVLQARLDSLPRAERQVLQRSSVIGRVFWEDASDRLAMATSNGGSIEPLDGVAPSLKQHELAYERDPSAFEFTREFIFKHAILHDVAYESVVRKVRRVYHHEVATWLVDAAGDRRAEFAGQIAEHYDRAGDAAEAVEWLMMTGDRARQTHAPDAALRAYGRVIEIAGESSIPEIAAYRTEALGGLGDVLTMQAEYQKAIETYQTLGSEAAEAGDHSNTARAEHGIATAETHRGRPREALEAAVRSRDAAQRCGDRSGEARAMFIEAWSNIRLGAFEDGIRVAGDVLVIGRELDEKAPLAEALNLQGVIAASTGSYDEAVSHFSEAASIYKSAGNEEKLMPILNNLGVIAELRGDFDEAGRRYEDALEMARDTSDRDAELVYSSNLGGTMVALDRPLEGEALLRSVIEMAPGEFSLLSETYQFLAGALLSQEEWDDAQAAAVTALELALKSEAPDHIAGAWRVLGILASRKGRSLDLDLEDGSFEMGPEQLFEKGLEVSRAVEADADIAKLLTAWAMHDFRNEDFESCSEHWAGAREILETLGADVAIERAEEIFDSAPTA